MTTDSWALIGSEAWRGALAAVQSLGGAVTAVVVGPRGLADDVATAGPAEVLWFEPTHDIPAEAYAGTLAGVVVAAAPRVLVATSDPTGRVLLGSASAQLPARLVPGVVGLAWDGEKVLIRRAAVGGATIETLATDGPVAAIYAGDEVSLPASAPAPVSRLDMVPAAMRVVASEPVAVATGLDDAQRVVSFGRGVRAKDDVALVRALAEALDAELACSMPIADDLGWLEKSRYVGRSGNHITPALYLAVGIAGAAQHMEGVRGAKVVAAINSDPEARIFQTADYGIVGDLYEVIPALIAEVHK
jgi:electron transfer flavoprotein alpha subunit